MRPGEFNLQYHVQSDRHTVFLRGELDLATAPEFLATIREQLVRRVSSITLDLGGVTFVDSTGLHAILRVRQLCHTHRCELALTTVQPQAQRLLEITGAEDLLLVGDSNRARGTHESFLSKRRRFADGIVRDYLRGLRTVSEPTSQPR